MIVFVTFRAETTLRVCIQNLYQIKEKALKWCRYGCNYYRGVASGFVGTGYIPGDNCGELQDLALELRNPTQVGGAFLEHILPLLCS